MAHHGYAPIKGTVGMWQHETRPTKFCVCVDDFGVKYFTKEDAEHLVGCLEKHYKVTKDWKGKNYCGLTMDWHYDEGYVDISMPKYVPESLKRLQHVPKKYPQYSPHAYTSYTPTQKSSYQRAIIEDKSPLLDQKETKDIQSIVGTFLYYARSLDHTLFPTINEIASMQAHPTMETKSKCQQLLDYANTYPHCFICYHANDMVLHIDSDAAYLVAPKARSRIAGFYQLTNHPSSCQTPQKLCNNG